MLDVIVERERQRIVEGYDDLHDDRHKDGELAVAAAAYALKAGGRMGAHVWPFEHQQFKPRGDRENLVRAGALILAELERLDRAEPRLPLEQAS
jgi:hypothetical protein